ncbi:MAG: tetratricopeptide repeat protein, partial [bacterium]
EQWINRLKFKEAEEEFKKAIALDSTFGLAYYRLAYAKAWWNEQPAKELIQKAMALIDRIPEKERYMVCAMNALLEKGYDAQLAVLNEMEQFYPDDKEMLFNIGDAYHHTNKTDKAVEYFEKVLAMDSIQVRTLEHLAEAYSNQKKDAKADTLLRKALELDPENPAVLLGLGWSLKNQKKFSEAEGVFRRGIQVEPENVWIQSGLGWSLIDQKKYMEAEKVFRRAFEIEPENRAIMNGLSQSMRKQNKQAELQQIFRKALESHPTNIPFINALGWQFFFNRKILEAEELFRKGLKLDSTHANLLNGLGWSLYRQRKYAESEKALFRAYERAPNHLGILNGLRLVTFENRNYESAKRFNEKYLEVDSRISRNNVSAHVLLGIIGILEKNFSSAENHLRQANSIDSTSARTYRHLGYLFAEQNRFEDALPFSVKAVSLDSSFANYNLLAWVLISGNLDIDRGISLAEKALEDQPENWALTIDAYSYFAIPAHSLSLAYMKKGNYQKAVPYLEQALEIAPNRQVLRNDLQLAKQKVQEISQK